MTSGIELRARVSSLKTRQPNVRALGVGLIEITVSAILLWVIFSRVDLASVKDRLAELTFVGVTLVAALLTLHAVLSAVRWQRLIRHLGGSLKLWPAVSAVLIERFVNQAVPSPVAGDGARFVQLARAGQNLRLAAYSIVIDRIFALGGIFGVVIISLPLAAWVIKSDDLLKSILAIAGTPVIGIAVLALVRRRWWERLRKVPLLHYPIGIVLRLRDVVIAPRAFAVTAGLSVLVQTLPTFCFVVLARDLHIPLAATAATVFIPLIMLASALPISIAGWGIREGAAVVLMSQAGIAAADALSLSVLFGLINLVTSCLCGIAWLITSRRVQK